MIAVSGQAGCSSPTTDIYLADVDCLLSNPPDPDPCGSCFYADAGDNHVDQWPIWLNNNDDQVVIFSHQLGPGPFAPMALVEKALDSLLPCEQYDDVVRDPFDLDPYSDMKCLATSPDDRFLLIMRSIYPSPSTACIWDSVNQTETWCLDAYNTSGGDWGFLHTDYDDGP